MWHGGAFGKSERTLRVTEMLEMALRNPEMMVRVGKILLRLPQPRSAPNIL